MPLVFNTRGSGWPGGIVQYEKNFKRQSLTGKALPDFRDKASMKPFQKKGSHCPGLIVVQLKDWQLVFIFSFQGSEVSSFIDKGGPDHKPDCMCTRVELSCPFLSTESKDSFTSFFSSCILLIICLNYLFVYFVLLH